MSCSCKNKGGNSSSLKVKDLLSNDSKLEQVVNTNYISKEQMLKRDKYSLLKFAICADQEAFMKAFTPHIDFKDFDDECLHNLAQLWETGKDKEYGFDVEQLYSTIEISPNQLSNCNIKFV